MKKNYQSIIKSFLACLIAWMCGGCTNTIVPEVETIENGLFEICLKTTPSVKVETRAVNEDAINDIWVIQLASDGSNALIAPQYFTAAQINNGANGEKLIKLLLKQEACKLCFIANTGNSNLFDTSSAALTSITQSFVEGKSMSHSGDWKAKMDALGYIPMSGTWNGTPTVGTAIPVTLIRAIAQLTAKITVDIPTGDVLSISSLQLKNVPAALQYWRESTSGTYPDAGGTFFDYMAVTSYSSNTWWMPENCRGIGSERYETDKTATSIANGGKATYLEIKGLYNGFNVTYRFYLGENATNNYNVMRNKIYTLQVTIKGKNSADARIQAEENILAWGDILCLDGNERFYTVKPDRFDATLNNAIGVVFYVGPHPKDNLADYANQGMTSIRGYALALNDASPDVQTFDWGPNVLVIPGTHDDFRGYYNTKTLLNISRYDYHACIAAANYDYKHDWWYLPSCGQLRYIHDERRSTFDSYLVKAGGKELGANKYWSSTEYYYNESDYIYFGSTNYGSFSSGSKSAELYVRAAITF